MSVQTLECGRDLVLAVRHAAAAHKTTWEALVPDHLTINLAAEDAEEDAFVAMATDKRRLRDHICSTYGISLRELASLAME